MSTKVDRTTKEIMKKYKKVFRVLIFIVYSALLVSCKKTGNGSDDIISDNDILENTKYEFSGIVDEAGIKAFAVKPSGELLVSTEGGKLCTYDFSGRLLTEGETQENPDLIYSNLCFDGEKCYAYDSKRSAVVELTESEPRVITDSLRFHTIRNMVAVGGKVYLLGIPLNDESLGRMFSFGAQAFENFGELVYCIDAESGNYNTLPLKNIVAEYRSESGKLYFYGWEEEKYYLYLYDIKKEKVAEKYHQDNMRNSLAVATDGTYLFAMTPDAGLVAINLKSGEETSIAPGTYALSGNHLQIYRGNVFLYDFVKKELLQTAFIAENGIEVTWQEPSGGKSEANTPEVELPKRDETITVCSYPDIYKLISTSMVKELTGMKTKLVSRPVDYEPMVTELMGGNSEVDIYLFGTGDMFSRRCRDLGIYEDLQGSEIISGYLEKCIDSVKQVARTDEGELFMLPLDISTDMTWYIEGNMKIFGITKDDLSTFDQYINTMERIKKEQDNYRYYNNAVQFILLCDRLYNLNYTDPENKNMDYSTELYRRIAEKLWTGWDMNSQTPFHPLFHTFLQDYDINFAGNLNKAFDFDKSRVIFKTGRDAGMFPNVTDGEMNEELSGWRAMSVPVLNDLSEKLPASVTFAIINPYSRQKEAALAYLEALAVGGADIYTSPTSIFLIEDMELYRNHYDISLPVIQDMYEIYARTTIELGYIWAPYMNYISDYQLGLITLDQALEEKRKQVEAYLLE